MVHGTCFVLDVHPVCKCSALCTALAHLWYANCAAGAKFDRNWCDMLKLLHVLRITLRMHEAG